VGLQEDVRLALDEIELALERGNFGGQLRVGLTEVVDPGGRG
jgi:hypothetical protein